MKRLLILLFLIAVPCFADNCANLPVQTTLAWNGLEKVPAMGWSPDSAFTTSVTEANIKAQSDLLVSSGLAAAGYTFVSISDWWAQRPSGTIIANPATFPDGMAATISYIHGDGLLAGVYSSPYTATCGGFTGSGTFESADASTFASWGADGLWYDGCSVPSLYTSCWSSSYQQVWQMMSQDIRATGRPMIMIMGSNYSSEGSQYDMRYDPSFGSAAGYNEVYPDNTDVVADGWSELTGSLLQQAVGFYKWERPGFFPFCEFLLSSTEASGRATFNQTQSQTQMGLYALWGCPLRLSMDISTLSAAMLNIYKNSGVIAVDQDALAHAAILYQQFTCGTASCQIWVKPLKGGAWSMGLLNLDSVSHTIAVNFTNFGGNPDVTDLWAATDLGVMTSYSTTVASNAIAMIKVIPAAGAAHTVTNMQLENMAIQ